MSRVGPNNSADGNQNISTKSTGGSIEKANYNGTR